ncbi:BspA family leucine-rich repeat surface protein [Mycoplasma capricolum]|uniref:BspA family leucine-rich repeat surface protein n=1 Tax=Mycoplasma capricolum TaxID=2095 RepID=UPI001FB75391|nr:BspA family leucine-rich repeat surface protein [Mycoplasma capricolum]
MKKLLIVLGSMTLIATVSANVIACKTTDSTISETQLAQKVQTIWNDNFKNKITSAKNYSMIIEMVKDKLNNPKEKELISLSNQEELKNRPIKKQENQKINIKIGERNISLDFGEVKEGKKLTKYRDPKTNEIKTTDAKDFSDKSNTELNEVKEIIEIGYYEHKDNHDADKLHIRAVVMPTSIQIVPKELPKEITSTRSMFWDAKEFNQDISMWDTSNLETIDQMFVGAKKFNQDISKWDVSNVRIMDYALSETEDFNQDLSNWNVGNVTSMKQMFSKSKFNNGQRPLTWNEKTKNVKTMYTMFAKNPVFNQDISKWDVSNVTDMTQMFLEAKEFNQDLSNWNVGNVKKMRFMFGSAEKFDNKGKSLNSWNVSKVEDMGNMFNKAKIFNQDISNWKTSSLTNIEAMFLGAEKFDQDLSKWDAKKIKTYAGYQKGANKWTESSKWPKINGQQKNNIILMSFINSFFYALKLNLLNKTFNI